MINDMASLKKAMEQMDAEDATVAEAAKDRAAKLLSDSGLNFSKLAELIEQRRLLLRPRIVANIRKMDQPEILSDAVFRDVSASLRKEGQSFRQIAEALELNDGTAPRYEGTARRIDGPVRLWPRALAFAMRTVGYPLRHPIRFLVVALLALMLLNGLRDFVGFGRRMTEYAGSVSAARGHWDAVTSSVRYFFEKRLTAPSQQAAAPPTSATPAPPASTVPTPSPSPANPPPSAAPSTGPAVKSVPPATTAAPPSKPAAKDRRQAERTRTLEEIVPPEIRRDSRGGGRCTGGIGGCYWGGGHY
jgi:hypothetical protein